VKSDEWRLAMHILTDLTEILQQVRGQRRVAEYLRQAGIAVFDKNIAAFTFDSDLGSPH
jgi:hypothetical protein